VGQVFAKATSPEGDFVENPHHWFHSVDFFWFRASGKLHIAACDFRLFLLETESESRENIPGGNRGNGMVHV
jgi:hypothetical protein